MARMPRPLTYALELKNAIADLAADSLHKLRFRIHGNTWWTPIRLLEAATLMSWHEGQTLTERFQHVRGILKAMSPDLSIPTSYTGFTQALARLIHPLMHALRPQLRRTVRQLAGKQWRIHGWVVFIADGSRFESPRTISNEQTLQCAGKIRTAPQVFQTTLLHLGTQAIWDFRCGPGTASERRHVEEMLDDLPSRSLIIADGGFYGFEFYQRLNSQNVKFLLRVGGNVTLKTLWKLKGLEMQGDEVWVWPDHKAARPPVRLRLIRLSQQGSDIYLVTNILDSRELSITAASKIYRQRWGIEVTYRSIKQTFDRGTWLSRTAANVLAEHQATILGYWLLQLKSLQELRHAHQKLDRWSPAASRRATRRILKDYREIPESLEHCWKSLLSQAVKDEYHRERSKKSRPWPHKKQPLPTQPPHLKPLTKAQQKRGENLLNTC